VCQAGTVEALRMAMGEIDFPGIYAGGENRDFALKQSLDSLLIRWAIFRPFLRVRVRHISPTAASSEFGWTRNL